MSVKHPKIGGVFSSIRDENEKMQTEVCIFSLVIVVFSIITCGSSSSYKTLLISMVRTSED
jgi:hypothetical protein